MQLRRLSSLLTVFYKFIFPALYSLFFLNMIFLVLRGDLFPGDRSFIPLMVLLAIIVTAQLVWIAFRIKRVETDGECLHVSNYLKQIVLPLSDINKVKEMRWMQPYWITLHLRHPSEFGEKIVFIPPLRLLSFWTENPLVNELKSMIQYSPVRKERTTPSAEAAATPPS